MTILELLQKATDHLKSKGITNPKTSSEILLAHTLGMKRLELYLNYNYKVSNKEREQFKTLYKRRLNLEPIQYITGKAEFMSLPFEITKDVLVPRPETELLVEKIIDFAKKRWGESSIKILDIGVGSGNISVSLAHYLPHARVEGIDLSERALALAQKNASKNNVLEMVNFYQKDILQAQLEDYHGLHIVVSNPPYVGQDQGDTLDKEVIDHEPHIALFAGEDKCLFYKRIADLAKSWLSKDGLLVFEIGYDIGDDVTQILTNRGYTNVALIQDYARLDRIVFAELPQ